MSITGSPSRLREPIDARDSVVIRDWCSSLTPERHFDFRPCERDLVDLADLDAGDPDDRAALQAFDVRKFRLETGTAAS